MFLIYGYGFTTFVPRYIAQPNLMPALSPSHRSRPKSLVIATTRTVIVHFLFNPTVNDRQVLVRPNLYAKVGLG